MRLIKLLEKTSDHAVTATITLFLKKLKVPVTTTTLIENIEQHPNFPSMLSISDTLTRCNVDHIALKTNVDVLEYLPTPFIAHSKRGYGSFILINSVNGSIEYFDSKGRLKSKTREEFIKEWDNVVLLAEPDSQSGEQNYSTNRTKEIWNSLRIPSVLAIGILLMLFFVLSVNPLNVAHGFLLLLKLAGSIAAALLLWVEIDQENSTLKKICSAGKKTNCSAVLGTNGARVFNFLSWSEIGLFYFSGGFLFLLLSNNTTVPAFELLSWLNIFALPYIFYSIFYQWRIARQWCPLCLIVQGILLLEFVTTYLGYWSSYYLPDLHFSLSAFFLSTFSLPVIFWIISKSAFLNAQNARQYKRDLAKMTYNREVLESLLLNQHSIAMPPDGLGITLGNPHAKDTIIKVCNPYCGPCAKAHPAIEYLLEYKPDLKVQIIFMGMGNPLIYEASRHLMAIYEKRDIAVMKEALNDWYTRRRGGFTAFAEKYPVEGLSEQLDGKLSAMQDWCELNEIAFTPTFFVNGCQLPEVYSIDDLKHIL